MTLSASLLVGVEDIFLEPQSVGKDVPLSEVASRVGVLLGPQTYGKSWPFRLFLEVLGHYVAYFWGPGKH